MPLNINWQQILLHLLNFAILVHRQGQASGTSLTQTAPYQHLQHKRGSAEGSILRLRSSPRAVVMDIAKE